LASVAGAKENPPPEPKPKKKHRSRNMRLLQQQQQVFQPQFMPPQAPMFSGYPAQQAVCECGQPVHCSDACLRAGRRGSSCCSSQRRSCCSFVSSSSCSCRSSVPSQSSDGFVVVAPLRPMPKSKRQRVSHKEIDKAVSEAVDSAFRRLRRDRHRRG
jgi:hypothetical protein